MQKIYHYSFSDHGGFPLVLEIVVWRGNRSHCPDIVNEIIAWCGGHPLLLQELVVKVARAARGVGLEVTREMLNQCRQSIVGNVLLRKIFAIDQRHLAAPQQAMLRAVYGAVAESTIEELALSSEYDLVQARVAIGFLENFGFIEWKKRISLRFRFYPDFLLPEAADSFTDE